MEERPESIWEGHRFESGTDFLNSEKSNLGIYKFTYFTNDYFQKNNTESFYQYIEVVFQMKDQSHYYVPITVSAFGYSTYRGS